MVGALEAVARPRAFPFLLQLASAVQGTEQVPSKCCSGKDTSFWHHSSSLSFRPGEFYGISDSPTAPTCTCRPPHAISEDDGEHCCHGGLVSLSQTCWAESTQKLNLNATKGRKG